MSLREYIFKSWGMADIENRLRNGRYDNEEDVETLINLYMQERLNTLKSLIGKHRGNEKSYNCTLKLLDTVRNEVERRSYRRIKTKIQEYRNEVLTLKMNFLLRARL
jgi:hypothetical protein